jgi:doubled CXXCH motif protein/cytochrome c554/c'-like protein
MAVLVIAAIGCTKPTPRVSADLDARARFRVPPLPDWSPARIDIEDYTGAATCGECHPKEYGAWKRSPHGRAMGEAKAGNVLGAFDARRVRIPDGWVTPLREGNDPAMKIEPDSDGAASETVSVDLVLGSGRQHQVYFSRDAEGSYRMLPLIWVTVTKRWIRSAHYQRGSADPGSPDYWRLADAVELGCIYCHLSQAEVSTKTGELRWRELPINCESCHGPGRLHVEQRRAGTADEVYGDLHAVPKAVDVAICAECHARRSGHLFPRRDAAGVPEVPLGTINLAAFRADGTQLITGYQTAGHLLSRCFSEGSLACSSCHDPHAQTARNLIGESAQGKNSNAQCTVCHRDKHDPGAQKRHHHHPSGKVSCVNCHMPFTWMMDDPEVEQRVSDHSISIPRPRESLELGLPNACNTCHLDKSPSWALLALERWGSTQALRARPWVRAMSAAKHHASDAAARLVEVLTASSTAGLPFLRMSALDGLIDCPARPELASRIEPFTRSDDPETRSLAYQAMLVHGETRSMARRALADPSPIVRAEALLVEQIGAAFDLAMVERALGDLARLDSMPAESYRRVAALLQARGEPEAARAVLDAIDESTP